MVISTNVGNFLFMEFFYIPIPIENAAAGHICSPIRLVRFADQIHPLRLWTLATYLLIALRQVNSLSMIIIDRCAPSDAVGQGLGAGGRVRRADFNVGRADEVSYGAKE